MPVVDQGVNVMIPKVIHYCWFGGNALSDKELNCINSWKKYCPDYEIMRWDESNFDVNANAYCREAYAQKKWAFVSDYARFLILYENGGLYFDTDVELIRPIQDIVDRGPFMGMQGTNWGPINTGLGLGAEKGMAVFRTILDHYDSAHFLQEDGLEDQTTVVERVTDLFAQLGFQQKQEIQKIAGVSVYPPEYFSPYDYRNGQMKITENTRSIHHYAATWLNEEQMKVRETRLRLTRIFGLKIGDRLGNLCASFSRFKQRVKALGLKGALKYYRKYL